MGRNKYSERPARLPAPTVDPRLSISIEARLDIYRRLNEMRQFSVAVNKLFLGGLIRGSTHLSTGMEAIAAGFGSAMRVDDYSFASYRGHAHTLAKGVSIEAALAELVGRNTGILKGKGGSMHLTCIDKGLMGSFAIVGAHLTIACGTAWSAQLRGTDQVTVCFFGDGAANIGAFHEALNIASIWKLPVIFVCENNLYMEYSPIDVMTAVEHPAADRASAYGLARNIIDGNDVDVVLDFASTSITQLRQGSGPILVEAMTYRHGGHSRADPGDYRPKEEVAAWIEHDPLAIYHQRLLALGVSEKLLVEIENETVELVLAATELVVRAEFPSTENAFTDLWADGSSRWRSELGGEIV